MITFTYDYTHMQSNVFYKRSGKKYIKLLKGLALGRGLLGKVGIGGLTFFILFLYYVNFF